MYLVIFFVLFLFPFNLVCNVFIIKTETNHTTINPSETSAGKAKFHDYDIEDLLNSASPALGEEFRITCRGKKNVKGCKFTLPSLKKLKSKRKTKTFQHKRITIKITADGCELVIKKVKNEDYGTWRCDAVKLKNGKKKKKSLSFNLFPSLASKGSPKSTISPLISTTTIRSCPNGWTIWNSRCYKMFTEEVSWYAAELKCTQY